MNSFERVVYLVLAALIAGGAIGFTFYILGVRWGEGWSKAIAFSLLALVLWVTWWLLKSEDKSPHR